jgi:hypothetical protein
MPPPSRTPGVLPSVATRRKLAENYGFTPTRDPTRDASLSTDSHNISTEEEGACLQDKASQQTKRAHLNEFPDYYTRLEQLEERAKRDFGTA